MATNGQGFREDADTSPQPAPGVRRYLVLGDSHTDGVVPNGESFPNLLEARLQGDGTPLEFINAGVGFYGPDHYKRALQVWGDMNLDGLIVTLYMGNDLLDTLRVREAAGRMAVPRPDGYYERLAAAQTHLGPGMAQGLNQLFLFWSRPELGDKAAGLTVEALLSLERQCKRRGISFYVAALPSKLRVEPEDIEAPLAKALKALGMPSHALDHEETLTTSVLKSLADAGVDAVDLGQTLRCDTSPCFWRRDHHLSTAGHREVARALMPLISH